MLQLFLIGARDIKIKGGYLSNQKIFIETNIPTAASKIE